MTVTECKVIHRLMADDHWTLAANEILLMMGKKGSVSNKAQAVTVCRGLFQHLLDSEMYLHAATLQWGEDMFNTEPESTVRVFKDLHESATVLLMGASSMSKTYAAGAFFLLDYLRDPLATTLKLAAVNEDHLRKNLFSHVANLYRACAIPCQYEIQVRDSDLWMGVKDAGYGFGISGIAFKQSQETSGQFKGYKAMPVRKVPHPKFGVMSRLRVLGDECFPYSQTVLMSDGSQRKIGDIVEGKESGSVISINHKTGMLEHKQIVGWHKVPIGERRIVEVNGTRMTEDHPIFTPAGYIEACKATSLGLRCMEIHENLFSTPRSQRRANLRRRWWTSWRRINQQGKRPEGECASVCDARTGSVGLSAMEGGETPAVRTVSDSRTIDDGVRWNNVSHGNDLPSGVHVNLQVNLSERQARRKEDLKEFVSLLGRSGDSRLVYGRRKHESNGNNAMREDLNLRIQAGGSRSGCLVSDRARDEVQEGPKQGQVDSDILGQRNESTNRPDSAIRSTMPELQDSRPSVSCEAYGSPNHARAHDPFLRDMREPVSEAQECQDVQPSVPEGASAQAWDESAQEGESVYCIDVADNHNFFAGKVNCHNCQNWPHGPFKDFNSLIASKSGSELVKIACAFNPESLSQHVVQLAEPDQGWRVEDMECLYDWESKAGWRVCRLDAARSENVIQRKVVYPGLQTYEGYISYLKAGGDNSPNFCTFARGWPPIKGTVDVVIPPAWPQEARGEATFIQTPVDYAAVDLAFMGKDSAQMTIGRWGLASGYRDQNGKFITFKDRLNVGQDKPRYLLQIDQILPMEKHDNTVQMAEEIMARCKNLNIKPEHVAVDATGYGFGVQSHLFKVWGPSLGIVWSSGATESKILADDNVGANKQCDGIMSEMWWAFRRWLEPSVRAILINPIIPTNPIQTQLTTRRYRTGTKGIKVEPKEEYKARNQTSPDEADALVMLVHIVRSTTDIIPGLVEQHTPANNTMGGTGLKLVSMKNYPKVENDDSISVEGQDEY